MNGIRCKTALCSAHDGLFEFIGIRGDVSGGVDTGDARRLAFVYDDAAGCVLFW